MSQAAYDSFFATWDYEAKQTAKLLASLPAGQYDFRPDPEARSLGELAWHLAEIEGYTGDGVENRKMDYSKKLPEMQRPREISALAPGYEKVHAQAVARAKKLSPADFDLKIPFMAGRELTIRDILWNTMLHHIIHHRGQLSVLTRLAKGVSPGMYGPNREEMRAMRAKA